MSDRMLDNLPPTRKELLPQNLRLFFAGIAALHGAVPHDPAAVLPDLTDIFPSAAAPTPLSETLPHSHQELASHLHHHLADIARGLVFKKSGVGQEVKPAAVVSRLKDLSSGSSRARVIDNGRSVPGVHYGYEFTMPIMTFDPNFVSTLADYTVKITLQKVGSSAPASITAPLEAFLEGTSGVDLAALSITRTDSVSEGSLKTHPFRLLCSYSLDLDSQTRLPHALISEGQTGTLFDSSLPDQTRRQALLHTLQQVDHLVTAPTPAMFNGLRFKFSELSPGFQQELADNEIQSESL